MGDPNVGILSVVRAATERRRRDAKGYIVHHIGIKEPKTPGSVRTHPLVGLCAEVLREHRNSQEQVADELGWRVTPETFVFGDFEGGQISPDAFSPAFYYATRKHALPVVSSKGLRTSFATSLLQFGVGTKDIADLLGHTTDRTTREHYLMEVPQNKIKAAKRSTGLSASTSAVRSPSAPSPARARRRVLKRWKHVTRV
jgi:integrase